jgi:glycosyltransferase involved in cell wall biosynthesis
MPRISCVIPVYNAELYLERSLRSVFEQSQPPDEISVVDDGSTDDTPKVLAAYGNRLQVLRQENGGPAAARNAGIRIARGELICFQDADDEWLPEKLARQSALLTAQPQTDVCITHLRNVWQEHLDSERQALGEHAYANDPPGYVFQTSLIRARAFAKVGLLKETLRTAEDIDWFTRARDGGIVVAVLPEVTVYRYLHGKNLSNSREKTASEHYDDLLKVMAARLKRQGSTER